MKTTNWIMSGLKLFFFSQRYSFEFFQLSSWAGVPTSSLTSCLCIIISLLTLITWDRCPCCFKLSRQLTPLWIRYFFLFSMEKSTLKNAKRIILPATLTLHIYIENGQRPLKLMGNIHLNYVVCRSYNDDIPPLWNILYQIMSAFRAVWCFYAITHNSTWHANPIKCRDSKVDNHKRNSAKTDLFIGWPRTLQLYCLQKDKKANTIGHLITVC